MDREEVFSKLGLPGELVLGLPLLTITGNRDVFVENHQGLLVYDQEHVVVKTEVGRIRVEGRGLILRTMDKEALFINGEIHRVVFAEGNIDPPGEEEKDAISRKAGE